jgi:hypothetical protein
MDVQPTLPRSFTKGMPKTDGVDLRDVNRSIYR